jgi:hypothetical protein
MDQISIGFIIFVTIIIVIVGFSKYNADKFVTSVAIERTMQVGGFIKGILKKVVKRNK